VKADQGDVAATFGGEVRGYRDSRTFISSAPGGQVLPRGINYFLDTVETLPRIAWRETRHPLRTSILCQLHYTPYALPIMLHLVGLGLADEKDITVRGLEIVKKAERVYLEAYTAILLVDKAKLVSEGFDYLLFESIRRFGN
jgi:hypothetical protein